MKKIVAWMCGLYIVSLLFAGLSYLSYGVYGHFFLNKPDYNSVILSISFSLLLALFYLKYYSESSEKSGSST